MRHIALTLVAALVAVGCNDSTQPDVATVSSLDRDGAPTGVVRVAAPTGDPATDVANIKAAVAAARPGAIIQFAQGTYAILATTQIVVPIAGVTLEGHPRGTIIQGVSFQAPDVLMGHFLLSGGHQSVQRLNFEGFGTALSLGAPGTPTGGYRVQSSTFRNGDLPIEFVGFSEEVTRILDNAFINVSEPFIVYGKTVHFRRNRVTAPDPAAAPAGRPSNAGTLLPELLSGGTVCENNVLEDNTISGIADGFIIVALIDESCRNNVIRENTFVNQRVFHPGEDNGTMVFAFGRGVDGNIFEHNVLRGSEGLGIVVGGGSDNRIVSNKFSNLPGEKETFTPFPGTAIFLGEPTSGNRVLGNEFKKVVNTVVDLGMGNIIDEEHGDANFAAVLSRRLPTGRGSRLPDYPKLQGLRDRMKH